MEFRQLLNVIWRYRHMIVLMCTCSIITSVGLTYVISDKYTSSTNVLIRPQQSVDFVPKRNDILDFPVSYHTPVGIASKTYTEIMKSGIVAERIVKAMGLDTLETKQGTGLRYMVNKVIGKTKELLVKGWTLLKYGRIEKADAFSAAVNRVQKSLSVIPTKETYLFKVEAEAKSPELAAAIANTAATILTEYMQEIRIKESQKTQQLSRVYLESAHRQLEQAREALVNFKQTEGIVSLDEETDLLLKSLFDLQARLTSVNNEIQGALAQKQELVKQLTEFESFIKTSEKAVDNPVIRELKLELAQKEVALAGLRRRYSPEHRELQALAAEISEIHNELKQQAPTLNSEVTTASNPIYESLLRQRAELDTQLKSLSEKKKDLTSSIEQKKNIVDKLPGKEAELANLELARVLEEQRYMLLSRQMQELEAAANHSAPFVTQIHIATPSLYPAKPIKVYYGALAAALSLTVGVGIVLLKEHLNVTLRSPQETEQALGLPVLMTIPRLTGLGKEEWPLMRWGRGRDEVPDLNRQHERVYVPFAVAIRTAKDGFALAGELVDISLGGACFCINAGHRFKPGESINLETDLGRTTGEKAALEGVVVRCNNKVSDGSRTTAAVKFVSVDKTLAAEIANLIERQERKLPPPLPLDFKESIRGLRVDVELCTEAKARSFLITSCGPQDGKSTLAINLALTLAGMSKTAVLIDANLKNPSLHKIFDLPNACGLSSILTNAEPPLLRKVASGLSIVTSGPYVKDSSALLARERMHELVESLINDYDFVLIDASALLSGADSAILASIVEKVVVVLDSGRTKVEDAQHAKQILDKVGASILGAVMNRHERNSGSHYACVFGRPQSR